MSIYSPSMKYGITFGSDKQPAYLMLAEYLKGFKVTKSELMSIFTNENDRKTAEQLFDLWNKIQNSDGNEEYIDCKELTDIGFQVLYYADNEEVEDDSPTNLSDKEVQHLYEEEGISGASSVLFKMVQYLSTKDIATSVESGDFKIDGDTKNLHAMKMKGIDSDGKTYKLTTNKGFTDKILGKKSRQNEEYIANFHGKNPELKTLTSRIYAAFLDDKSLELVKITAPNGVVGTVGKFIQKECRFDKHKKLALDILLGNNATASNISFDNAFDTNKDGIRKAFTIIPNEIGDIIKNCNYSYKDLIKALSIIAELSDERIDELLDTDEAKNEYKAVLLKRRDFCKELLSELSEESKSKNLPEQIESAKISVIEKLISQISDIRDVNAYEREIRKISDNSIKEELTLAITDKKLSADKPQVIEYINAEEFEEKISQFGFRTDNGTEQNGKKYIGLTKKSIKVFHKKYPQLPISSLVKIDFNYVLDCMNLRGKEGINVLKDKETFIKFLITENNFKNFTIFDEEPKKYDYNTYMAMLAAHDIPMSDKNLHGVKNYKDDKSYKYFHEMYKANSDIGMQVIEEMSNKYGLEDLSQFLNKASLPFDTKAYRGQELSLMDNIQLPDGSNLAERMVNAVKQLPDETEINKVIAEFNQLGTISMNQPKFISTSVNKHVAENFARKKEGILMDITLPAGSKAACLDALVPNKYKKCEEEILVQRGSDYIITGLHFDKENKIWVIDCSIETK